VRVELHPDARAELRSAALWYDEQREGLGTEFLTEVASALDRISRAPESSPPWTGLDDRAPAIRRHTMHRFPYVVAFEQHQERVLVLAIAHAKRRPLYWLTRAEQ
jgi:plasmid stabilization system protein ParE